MNEQKEKKGENFLSVLIGTFILLVGAAAVFYAAYKVSYVSVDYGIHVDIARELDWRDPVQMLKEHPLYPADCARSPICWEPSFCTGRSEAEPSRRRIRLSISQ